MHEDHFCFFFAILSLDIFFATCIYCFSRTLSFLHIFTAQIFSLLSQGNCVQYVCLCLLFFVSLSEYESSTREWMLRSNGFNVHKIQFWCVFFSSLFSSRFYSCGKLFNLLSSSSASSLLLLALHTILKIQLCTLVDAKYRKKAAHKYESKRKKLAPKEFNESFAHFHAQIYVCI